MHNPHDIAGYREIDTHRMAAAFLEFSESLELFAQQVQEIIDAFIEKFRGFFDACFKILMAGQWLNKWLLEWRRILRKAHVIPGPQRRHDLINRIRLRNSIKHLPESVVARFVNANR